MKGRIGTLFEEENSGRLIDEKGKERFFHFEQVRDSNPVREGVIVDFSPSKNDERGLIATQISILETLSGTINILNDKGFGFLIDQQNAKRWFHFNDVKNSENPDSIQRNDRVIFTPSENERGLVAKNLFLLDLHPEVSEDRHSSSSSLTDEENNYPPLSEWDSPNPPVGVGGERAVFSDEQSDNYPPLSECDSPNPPVAPEASVVHSGDEKSPPLAEWDSPNPPVGEKTSEIHEVEDKPSISELWGNLDVGGDEEPPSMTQSKPEKTQQPVKSPPTKPAEVKKGPSYESRIYHKDEEHLSITDPVIIRCNAKEKNGLLLENCSNVTIENVQVLKSELACLRLRNCHHVTLKNCTFEGSYKAQGIQILHSFDIKLENVTCRKNANTGIDIQQGCHDISITSSNMLDNVNAALRIIDGNNVSIKNGTFGGSSKGQGIQLTNSFAIMLENITCKNNANVGIDIQKGCYDISITESKLLDNVKAGLRMVDGHNVTGRDLRLNKTQDGNGIWFHEVQHIEFVNCHFDDNHYQLFREWSGADFPIRSKRS